MLINLTVSTVLVGFPRMPNPSDMPSLKDFGWLPVGDFICNGFMLSRKRSVDKDSEMGRSAAAGGSQQVSVDYTESDKFEPPNSRQPSRRLRPVC